MLVRTCGWCALAALAVAALAPAPAADTAAEGWVDLTPGKDLKGWKRVPLAPDTTLNPKNPWSVTGDKVLLCDGVGIKEMLLHEKVRGDGTFRVEWRFRPVAGKDLGYNSGLYVRSADDGKNWIQSQVALQADPPYVGDLFYDKFVDGKPTRVVVRGKGKDRVKPLGEWNVSEIACKGSAIRVKLNGEEVVAWAECPVPRGHVGLQAELYFIEFRKIQFKEGK